MSAPRPLRPREQTTGNAERIAAIRAAKPLSRNLCPDEDPLGLCNVCLEPARQFTAWRECGEYDGPIPGDAALVFVGVEHDACGKALAGHPRLYVHEGLGRPGRVPLLCGPCGKRKGLGCTDPRVKDNGGAGLPVELSGANGVACGPGGCRVMPRTAVRCEGFVERASP